MNSFLKILLGLVILIVDIRTAIAAESVYGQNAKPMIVSYLKLDDFGTHYHYRYQLIERALALTRTEFGDYTYQAYTTQSTSTRYAKLLGEGTQLNLLWASPGTPIANANVIAIPIDILKGLLGYRACLINKNAPDNLSTVKDKTGFEKIKVGQGQWPDRAIYQSNRISEVDAPTFDALFKMLSAHRFDCIPLGIDEIEQIYQEKKSQYPFLAIDPHLLIYYHYPVYFYVSKKTPELAQRITLGLQRMQDNGELDQLFIQFHSKHVKHLDLKKRTLICLTTPYTQEQGDCKLPQMDLNGLY